jgi:hypothetical protein
LLAGAKCRAFFGGRTTVNGVKNNDQQGGSRVGATLAFPVPRNYSVKFYALTGFNADREHDFDAVGIAWQYRWGGRKPVSPLIEIALVSVYFNQFASHIVNMDHGIM